MITAALKFGLYNLNYSSDVGDRKNAMQNSC